MVMRAIVKARSLGMQCKMQSDRQSTYHSEILKSLRNWPNMGGASWFSWCSTKIGSSTRAAASTSSSGVYESEKMSVM